MEPSIEEIAKSIDLVGQKPGLPELVQALNDVAAKIERRPRLVAAIADPATTDEAFYSMLFGEVDDLLHQVKTLEKTLPELNAEIIVKASEGLANRLGPFFTRTEQNIGETIKKMEEIEQRFDGRFGRFMAQAAKLEKLPIEQLNLDIANSYKSRDAAVYSIKQAIEEHNKMIATLKDTASRIEKAKLFHLLTLFTATVFGGLIGGALSAMLILHS